ncbi:hypothetical protein [Bradyrhizobium sp. CCBAU 11434]|nr:hypothetical protein [Bradyrhizobium sp. CCBAU 11434]
MSTISAQTRSAFVAGENRYAFFRIVLSEHRRGIIVVVLPTTDLDDADAD